MNLKAMQIGFIGCGQIGRAIIKGLLKSTLVTKEQIWAFDVFESAVEEVIKGGGLNLAAGNQDLVARCQTVFLAVKPQVMPDLLPEIKESSAGRILISVAAGYTTASIEAHLHPEARVVRVMPNTPALIGQGASALCKGSRATDDDLALARKLMGAVGLTVVASEKLFDVITAVSGSGPAYTYLFMEGLMEAAVRLGLPWETARVLVLQTVKGSAALALESGANLNALKHQVMSPGGTTAASLQVAERAGFKGILDQAVEVGTKRSAELGKSN